MKDMRRGRWRINEEAGGVCVRLVDVVTLQQTKEILLVPCVGRNSVSAVNNKQQRAKRGDEKRAQRLQQKMHVVAGRAGNEWMCSTSKSRRGARRWSLFVSFCVLAAMREANARINAGF